MLAFLTQPLPNAFLGVMDEPTDAKKSERAWLLGILKRTVVAFIH